MDHRLRLAEMSVADAMSDGIVSLPRTAPLSEVADLMARERIHCVVVDPATGNPVGVLSTLDVTGALAGLMREGRGCAA